MKKILLGLVSAAALLTSCSSSNGSSSDGSLRINPSTVDFSSNYTVTDLNFNGSSYTGPVICDNAATLLNFSFDYTGDLDHANVRMRGATTGQATTLNVTNTNWSGSHGSVDFIAGSGTVPLSLKAKTQYVVSNPAVIGATYVEMEGVTSTGAMTNTVRSNLLPVLNNCI